MATMPTMATKIVLSDGSSKSNVRVPHSSSFGSRKTFTLGAPLTVLVIGIVNLERYARHCLYNE